ncbi:MAG TPA: thermostable hemolysin [Methylophilus sp.]|uniref:thermostable hemolysin n=1 Tax=Methylophilus sp. TaxID=29541 RepID=UPI002CAE1677|nr:thermostable hemolysin [Methylophilus sp.]HSH86608.1 thermostable hemolysin [Methylophilus sp.]
MLNQAIPVSMQAFFAEAAYDLRIFAKPKRYTLQEIKAHEINATHADRAEVEAFIAEVFYRAYRARIKHFMPRLIALRDEEHHLMAAFGMREASDSVLFLEQYLDEPIEAIISKRFGQTILRSEITEIGNLAVANPRNSGILISHVIEHSLAANVQWCVATAHHTLQNGLIKGGVDVRPLHAVNPERLPADERVHWGSYYEQTPQIIAVSRMAGN